MALSVGVRVRSTHNNVCGFSLLLLREAEVQIDLEDEIHTALGSALGSPHTLAGDPRY